jgi:hypothetical protein
MVSGLSNIQAMADADDLAGVTAVFYAISYSGFFLPMILAALAPTVGYGIALGAVAVVCLICAGISTTATRRLPAAAAAA